eukprot:3640113-Pyramimonas_sp.AAC.1
METGVLAARPPTSVAARASHSGRTAIERASRSLRTTDICAWPRHSYLDQQSTNSTLGRRITERRIG